MTTSLILFIAVALTFYVLFAGADFGAGILELFPNKKQSRVVTSAIGPIWEANHVWLILVIVILFMGFPEVYVVGSTYLHLPAVAVLVGIIARGCAFTYRHYDPKSEDWFKGYTLVFSFSSLWTALWLGVLAASLQRGRIPEEPRNFMESFILPWLGFYPLSVGLFTACIFTYLASIYLVSETSDAGLKKFFRRRAFLSNIAMLFSGALVFLASHLEGINLLGKILGHPVSLIAFLASIAAFLPIWKGRSRFSRLIAGFQVLMVLIGWYVLNAENVLVYDSGKTRTLYDAAAPPAVQKQLLLALVVGTVFILPSLYLLIRIFKGRNFWVSKE